MVFFSIVLAFLAENLITIKVWFDSWYDNELSSSISITFHFQDFRWVNDRKNTIS